MNEYEIKLNEELDYIVNNYKKDKNIHIYNIAETNRNILYRENKRIYHALYSRYRTSHDPTYKEKKRRLFAKKSYSLKYGACLV